MKNEYLLAGFVAFVGIAFLFAWFNVSEPSLQVGGSLYGIPGTDPISPLMGALIVIWFLLVGFVVYLNRPES